MSGWKKSAHPDGYSYPGNRDQIRSRREEVQRVRDRRCELALAFISRLDYDPEDTLTITQALGLDEQETGKKDERQNGDGEE